MAGESTIDDISSSHADHHTVENNVFNLDHLDLEFDLDLDLDPNGFARVADLIFHVKEGRKQTVSEKVDPVPLTVGKKEVDEKYQRLKAAVEELEQRIREKELQAFESVGKNEGSSNEFEVLKEVDEGTTDAMVEYVGYRRRSGVAEQEGLSNLFYEFPDNDSETDMAGLSELFLEPEADDSEANRCAAEIKEKELPLKKNVEKDLKAVVALSEVNREINLFDEQKKGMKAVQEWKNRLLQDAYSKLSKRNNLEILPVIQLCGDFLTEGGRIIEKGLSVIGSEAVAKDSGLNKEIDGSGEQRRALKAVVNRVHQLDNEVSRLQVQMSTLIAEKEGVESEHRQVHDAYEEVVKGYHGKDSKIADLMWEKSSLLAQMNRVVREMNELKVKNALRIHELEARLLAMEELKVGVNNQEINLEEGTEAKLVQRESLIWQQLKELENLKLMIARTDLELESSNVQMKIVDDENASYEAKMERLLNEMEEMKSKANGLEMELKESKKLIMKMEKVIKQEKIQEIINKSPEDEEKKRSKGLKLPWPAVAVAVAVAATVGLLSQSFARQVET